MVLSELTPSTCNCRIDRPTSCPASKSSISRGDWTEGTEPIVPQHRHCGSPLRQCGKPSAPGRTAQHQRPYQVLEMATLASKVPAARPIPPDHHADRERRPDRGAVAGQRGDRLAVGPGSAQRGGGVRDPGSGQRQRDHRVRVAGRHGAAGHGRAHPDDLGAPAQRPPRLGQASAAHRRVPGCFPRTWRSSPCAAPGPPGRRPPRPRSSAAAAPRWSRPSRSTARSTATVTYSSTAASTRSAPAWPGLPSPCG